MRQVTMGLVVALLMSFSQARAADYPETPAGLEALSKDILDAVKDGKDDKAQELIKGLVLPNADKWFVTTWGEEKGKAIAEQYAPMAQVLPAQILRTFKSMAKKNQTNIKAYKLESAEDNNGTGLQKSSIEAMKVKVPLYGVRFVAPGQDSGMHLWPFVYVDGGFRMIGKSGGGR